MNWDAVGAIAELLGAAGVIASLVYLATQIRQNTGSVRAATYQSLISAHSDLNSTFSSQPETVNLLVRANADLGSLSPEDRTRFELIIYQFFITFEGLFLQQSLGTLDAQTWQARRVLLERWFAGPAVRAAWHHDKQVVDERFARFIEGEVLPLYEPAAQQALQLTPRAAACRGVVPFWNRSSGGLALAVSARGAAERPVR